jgi:hypothetical protein
VAKALTVKAIEAIQAGSSRIEIPDGLLPACTLSCSLQVERAGLSVIATPARRES